MSDEKPAEEAKEWVLEAETEYRFELDPKASLAIKVRRATNLETGRNALLHHSSLGDTQKCLGRSLQRASRIYSAQSARRRCIHGRAARLR